MNDADAGPGNRDKFRAAYDTLIDRITNESNALILLHTPNPITADATSRKDLPAYANIIRDIAK